MIQSIPYHFKSNELTHEGVFNDLHRGIAELLLYVQGFPKIKASIEQENQIGDNPFYYAQVRLINTESRNGFVVNVNCSNTGAYKHDYESALNKIKDLIDLLA